MRSKIPTNNNKLLKKDFLVHLKQTRDLYFPHYKFYKFNYKFIKYFLNSLFDGQRILINAPPRIGKSLTFKLIATACLTYEKFNDFKILYCSYGQEFANTFSNDIKLLLQANYNLYQGYSKLNELKLESNNNYLYATGIGGKLTGRGFDLIILDDLYKNFDEYLSKKYNTKLINFYNNVLITRLNNVNKGSVFCIMTRWGVGTFRNT